MRLRPGATTSYAVHVLRTGTLPAASFGFRLAVDTLAVRITVPIIRVRRGLTPPSECTLVGAPRENRPPEMAACLVDQE